MKTMDKIFIQTPEQKAKELKEDLLKILPDAVEIDKKCLDDLIYYHLKVILEELDGAGQKLRYNYYREVHKKIFGC